MVRPADESRAVARMAELQAVDPGYPLYGQLVLRGGTPFTHALLDGHGVLVRPELLVQLGIAVGDQVRIGESTFTIRGVIESEPGRRAGMFSLGPRVIIARRDLEATRAALVRVARPLRDPDAGGRAGHRAARRGRARAVQGQLRRRRVRTGRPKTASARTSVSPRTT